MVNISFLKDVIVYKDDLVFIIYLIIILVVIGNIAGSKVGVKKNLGLGIFINKIISC